tara:strand:- start:1808 stop:1984 length:177 start_codon:yes stop_codon:yes gene_type:complete
MKDRLFNFNNAFASVCMKYYIDPAFVLENENVKNVLRNGNLSQEQKLIEIDSICLNEF